jgi:hypothetical protein
LRATAQTASTKGVIGGHGGGVCVKQLLEEPASRPPPYRP